MKGAFFFLSSAALLLSAVPGEARWPRHLHHRPRHIAITHASAGIREDGSLVRDRGVSGAEAATVAAIVREAAGARAVVRQNPPQNLGQRKLANDFYRAYPQPTVQRTVRTTAQPSTRPTFQTAVQPAARPTFQTAVQPAARPTFQTAVQPTFQTAAQPTARPNATSPGGGSPGGIKRVLFRD